MTVAVFPTFMEHWSFALEGQEQKKSPTCYESPGTAGDEESAKD